MRCRSPHASPSRPVAAISASLQPHLGTCELDIWSREELGRVLGVINKYFLFERHNNSLGTNAASRTLQCANATIDLSGLSPGRRDWDVLAEGVEPLM